MPALLPPRIRRQAWWLLTLLPWLGATASAQQLVPGSQGFTYGTTSGTSSFYRQQSRSEASVIQQVLLLNAAPLAPGSDRYSITNPAEAFSVVDERQSQSAGDSETTTGRTSVSGSNFSVFSN